MFDIVTVGHFSIDYIDLNNGLLHKSLGGPPTYVSLAALALDSRVSVISKVGNDFPEEYARWLRELGIDLSLVKRVSNSRTTSYLLKYVSGGRKLRLLNRGPPIEADDIPENLKTEIIHVAPITGEITENAIIKARDLCEIFSLDPQGLVRQFNKEGWTKLVPPKNKKIFSLFDVLKSSELEACVITGVSHPERIVRKLHEFGINLVIITMGEKGLLLSQKNRELYWIPSCISERVKDTTGAGDTFIGAFLSEFQRGKDPIWCGCIGSAAASISVENVGPAVLGYRSVIYSRAERAYERVAKI